MAVAPTTVPSMLVSLRILASTGKAVIEMATQTKTAKDRSFTLSYPGTPEIMRCCALVLVLYVLGFLIGWLKWGRREGRTDAQSFFCRWVDGREGTHTTYIVEVPGQPEAHSKGHDDPKSGHQSGLLDVGQHRLGVHLDADEEEVEHQADAGHEPQRAQGLEWEDTRLEAAPVAHHGGPQDDAAQHLGCKYGVSRITTVLYAPAIPPVPPLPDPTTPYLGNHARLAHVVQEHGEDTRERDDQNGLDQPDGHRSPQYVSAGEDAALRGDRHGCWVDVGVWRCGWVRDD